MLEFFEIVVRVFSLSRAVKQVFIIVSFYFLTLIADFVLHLLFQGSQTGFLPLHSSTHSHIYWLKQAF